MILYLESSAVLTWLLGEPGEAAVRRAMSDATRLIASQLTALECARGIARAVAMRRIRATDESAALRLLDTATAGWEIHALSEGVLARARARFPVEPVRTLDALHLATAAIFRDAIGVIQVLSLDARVRENATRMGLAVLPD